jgi:hypothetical protein
MLLLEKEIWCALILIFLGIGNLNAQSIPAERLTDWSKAGVEDSLTDFGPVVNITDYGAVADGITANDTAFSNAMAALAGKPGIILFPAGSYLFHHSINITDSVVLRGEGTGSKLLFDLNGATANAIVIQGISTVGGWKATQAVSKNDSVIYIDNASGLKSGDWIQLYGNDSDLVASEWAYKSVGQIMQVATIQGNKITTKEKLRREYGISFALQIKRVQPVKNAGIECLYIERMDSTAQQTSNIFANYVVNCHITGIESYHTNFAHIEVDNSAHITIRGNYIHHSYGYGDNGQGYGVAMEYTSGDCLVENNIFEHLRHAMLVQAGANGNVFAYNYSKDAYWNEPGYPANASGDIVCHGNYPYLNLFEGNIVQNIVVDNSHGINGPFNTFFRNRAELWGIVQAGSPASDSMNYIGNEITCSLPLMGNYIVAGAGLYQSANNVNGVITPLGTGALTEHSLYLTDRPGFWFPGNAYPGIGAPCILNSGKNTAALRDSMNEMTDCIANPKSATTEVPIMQSINNLAIYPNPVHGKLFIRCSDFVKTLEINALNGTVLFSGTYKTKELSVDVSWLHAGIYVLRINGIYVQKMVKE